MKDISKFSDEFENIIKESKIEEDAWYAMEVELNKKYIELAEKNVARVEKLKIIRKQKIDEIENSLRYYIELNIQLTGQLHEIVKHYCEKKGHKDVVTGYTCLGNDETQDSINGELLHVRKYTKCLICERISWEEYSTTKLPVIEKYQKSIPEDIYSNISFTNDGKTYEAIENEINNNNSYISYLNYLKEYMCELFGHESNDNLSRENYVRCDLCGKIMPKRIYEEQRKTPMYKGVVGKWSPLYEKKMIINQKDSLIISLPTYDEYLAMKSGTYTEKDAKILKRNKV